MRLKGGVIISCQATESEPLYGLGLMKYFARAAVAGGATGIRCLADELQDIRSETDVPIIGLVKRVYQGSGVYGTPPIKEVDELIALRPDVIAVDATDRRRPDGETLAGLVAHARCAAPDIHLMADCATIRDAENALALGFEYVSTTLHGYTTDTKGVSIPDYDFIEQMKALVGEKLIVEGGIWTDEQLKMVMRAQPFAVVIGTAVTRPKDITARFCKVFHAL